MKLYSWQEEFINHKGDVAIVGPRQCGKSIAAAERCKKLAIDYPGTNSLIIAGSERQESYLFEKVTAMLQEKNALAKVRQTLSRLTLKNGSRIVKIPVGTTGYYAKGGTIDFLYPDEAAYINDLVWDSIIPMLAVARGKGLGWITMSSTAFGKRGYFYQSFQNPKYKKFLITADMCPHLTKEFLAEELERMGQRRYDQEYGGKFLDDAGQYFPTELITKCMNFKFWNKTISPGRRFYLGIDLAGMGVDEEAFCCGEIVGTKVRNIYNETLKTSDMRMTLKTTDKMDHKLKFRKIFIDSGGMGVGYEDIFKERYGKKRVVGLNNSTKSKEMKKAILKEDLYSNCLRLMSEGNLDLIQDEAMAKSLQSIQIIDGKINGKDDHLAEALTKMCWCVKEKGLNLFAV